MKASPTFIQWWKEFRAVLPIWAGAMVALGLYSLSNVPDSDHSLWKTVIFMVGSVVVCSLVYTREFQDRTLIWKYLQPVNRLTVLGRKSLVAAVLQTLLCGWYALFTRIDWLENQHALEFGCLVSVLAVTSCCLWAALIRNPINTVVVSFLVPVVLSMVLVAQLEPITERIASRRGVADSHLLFMEMWAGAMMIYALVCAGLAVLFWRRLQLVGEVNSVSSLDTGVAARLLGDNDFRRRPVWLSLVRKELGVIRYVFWIFGVFLVAATVFAVVDRTMDHLIAVAQSQLPPGQYLPQYSGVVAWQGDIRMVAAALFVLMTSLVPLLCGALAFTEETYLGTRGWDLCQPVRSMKQWSAKLAVSLAISMIVGLLVPGVMVLVFHEFNIGGDTVSQLDPERLLQAVVLHFLLFSLAAWCATWSRTTVITIMKAFLAVALFVLLVGEVASLEFVRRNSYGVVVRMFDWRLLAGVVSVFAIIASMMNFRFIQVPTRRWVWQGAGLVFVSLATSLPYVADVLFRFYEF